MSVFSLPPFFTTARAKRSARITRHALALAALLAAGAAHGDSASPVAAPAATNLPASPVTTGRELNAPAGLLASDLGRNLLRYVVECALPADASLATTVQGEPLQFSGSMGLAPAWRDHPLTPDEQRWVSACVLARVNYFGEKVPLNLQGDHPLPALRTVDDASRAYGIDEGAFYGNVFLPQPVAYACSGRGPFPATSPWVDKRICTRPTLGDGKVTWCGFTYTGACSAACAAQDPETRAYRNCKAPDGSVYSQVLSTQLREH